ncbi:MAG TPA: DivIVA domain-containing protein [Bacillota bacterium]|nr:DivIVA domain-containing protein [Clostridiaceae bacterium]HNR05189.1 DivIVA domain-containing protein [Bacillota bacterium]HPA54922.1 DivIVA domain-containing protein [Bacillota bacterium]HPX69203.1 DivIVA domain-containing protein [Bacillota bacterium]HQA65360.1 DivIVA domain-containing protein [Bacillota bacterium]
MITPMDIRNKEFKKAFKGYKEDEVDEFLDKVVADYERIYRENGELKDRIAIDNDRIESYNSMEKSLQSTLLIAQTTAEDIVANARKKAEMIINEAEDQGRKIIEEANSSVIKVNKDFEELKKEVQVFKTRFKTLLESELEALNATLKDI